MAIWEACKQVVGIVALAQQKSEQNQHSKYSSDFEGMIILPAQLSELTGSSKANSTGSLVANSSPGSTQTRQTSNKDTINHVRTQTTRCKDDMLCGMRCGMLNARYDRKMHEPGLNLEFQGGHWKYEMKSLENDIKNAGIGVTVWKWQAIQN